MAEILVSRTVPGRRLGDENVEHGWVWDDVTGQIVGYEGVNPTPDTFRVVIGVGALSEEFVIPAQTTNRIRFDLPPSRRMACRPSRASDHLWQRLQGWVPGFDSITVEREYGAPERNSPAIASVAVTEFFGGATTSHNVPMPATVDSGDGLIVMFFHDNASIVQASGFAPLSTATATDRAYVFARVAVGNEDSANVNFLALTASFAVAHTYRISAGTWPGHLSAIQVAAATGTSTTPDPPNLTPLWGSDDNMWLVFCGKIQASVTGAPTNYTNFNGDSSDLSGSARRSLTASSENPGTFSGANSFAWMAFTIAVASDDATFGDIPLFVGVGNTSAGIGAVTAALPGGIVTGDKLLLHIQGEGEDANADAANADWTLVETTASATGGAAGDTRLTVYEVDYNSAAPPDLSIPDAGDHIICFITAWRDPNGGTLDVHVSQATSDATGDTSLSATGVTTTIDNALIVVSVGLGDDSGVLTWVNASLANPSITPAGSDRTTSGSDGSLGVAFGGLAAQGASGTTTGTFATSEEEANIVLALVPVAAAVTPRRVSRLGMEVLNQDPSPERQLSRLGLETLHQDPNPERRLSRLALEVLMQAPDPNPDRRVSRLGIEALLQNPSPDARISRLSLEALLSLTETITIVEVEDENISLSESVLVSRGLVRLLSEATEIEEQNLRTLVLIRLMNEGISLAEQIVSTVGLVRLVSEATDISHQNEHHRGMIRVLTEVLDLSETDLSVAGRLRIISEGLQLSESDLLYRTLTRIVTEGESLIEQALRLRTIILVQLEGMSLSESDVIARALVRTFGEGIDLSELLQTTRGLVKEISDQIDISDQDEFYRGLFRVVDEEIDLSESDLHFLIGSGLVHVVSEILSVDEADLRFMVLVREVAEVLGLSEQELRARSLTRGISENESVQEVLVRVQALLRAQSEGVQITETDSWVRGLFKVVIEEVQAAEGVIGKVAAAITGVLAAWRTFVPRNRSLGGHRDYGTGDRVYDPRDRRHEN